MNRKITLIEPNLTALPNKKRVAAYARVSSGKDAMLHSLSAQISYYSNLIQMLKDCKDGKFDMIITKSISRFARNTVTLLEVVRELKSLNIDVFFEEENIHSLSGDGELMLTILASYAQEESRSVSENCKWRIRKKFEQGLPSNLQIYGYKLQNNVLKIIEEEADVVKMIFTDYLGGMGKNTIMKKLNRLKIKPKYSNSWYESTIYKILRNEKYCGEMLLQKTYVSNHIDKKSLKNNGELPIFLLQNSHEAIIDKEVFEKVGQEIEKRSNRFKNKKKSDLKYPFTSKIQCGTCGKNYRRKISNAGTKYEKAVWICGTYNQCGKNECSSKQIPEEILKVKSAEILSLNQFDETKFNKEIEQIRTSGNGVLLFCFKTGEQISKVWENPSRSESWTIEMKEKARNEALCNSKKQ
ncbi:hypothetical protein FACS189465_1070 [Clostridia bacterium]|nr:hypothetical protein FACS189465_1070 [Clostridia bacterium]